MKLHVQIGRMVHELAEVVVSLPDDFDLDDRGDEMLAEIYQVVADSDELFSATSCEEDSDAHIVLDDAEVEADVIFKDGKAEFSEFVVSKPSGP